MPNKLFYVIFFVLSLGFGIGFVLEPTLEHSIYLSLCMVIGLLFFVMDRKMRPEPETEEIES